MLCKRCMGVMNSGTRYEKRKEQESITYRRFFDCINCHDRVYVNTTNIRENVNREHKKEERNYI